MLSTLRVGIRVGSQKEYNRCSTRCEEARRERAWLSVRTTESCSRKRNAYGFGAFSVLKSICQHTQCQSLRPSDGYIRALAVGKHTGSSSTSASQRPSSSCSYSTVKVIGGIRPHPITACCSESANAALTPRRAQAFNHRGAEAS